MSPSRPEAKDYCTPGASCWWRTRMPCVDAGTERFV